VDLFEVHPETVLKGIKFCFSRHRLLSS
jgi:hypothetical protein